MNAELIARLAVAARWVGVRLSIARGFAAWCFYLVWPTHGPLYRVGFAVLPYAGDYAYADDPWVKECRDHWIRTGAHLTTEASDGPF